MELFEDIEFKPLTEGLGFHRNAPTQTKTPDTGAGATAAGPAMMKPMAPPSSKLIPPPELPKKTFTATLKPEYQFLDQDSLNKSKSVAQELNQTKVYEPIGRKDYVSPTLAKTSEAAKKASFGIPVPGAPASLSALQNQNSNPVNVHARATITPKPMTKPAARVTTASTLNLGESRAMSIPTCVPAAILDAAFSFGVSLILLVGVLLMTKADLVALLSNSQTDRFTQIQLGVLFIMVLEMYTLVSRSTFFGQTIGEWTYDIQLGSSAQKQKAVYPIQVVWRSLVFILTGFVLIPLLSQLFGRDLAKPLTGLGLEKNAQK